MYTWHANKIIIIIINMGRSRLQADVATNTGYHHYATDLRNDTGRNDTGYHHYATDLCNNLLVSINPVVQQRFFKNTLNTLRAA